MDPRKTLIRRYKGIVRKFEEQEQLLALMADLYKEYNEKELEETCHGFFKMINEVHQTFLMFRRKI